MELYVTQLIEDLEAAHPKIEPSEEITPEEEIYEEFFAETEESEEFLSGENHVKIFDLIGFLPEQFPPSNRLNTNQMKRIFFALDQLLDSFNIDTNLPNKLPIKRKYELAINELNEKVFVSKHGFTHLEYCKFDIETCPFGKKYCECKIVMDEFDKMPEPKSDAGEDDELPF